MNGITPITDWSHLFTSYSAPAVIGLDDATQDLLDQLFQVWSEKRPRNLLRSAYADGKHRLEHIGFSIPPSMRELETVVGWPAKAVNAHAERCIFDGFVSPNNGDDPFELDSLLSRNSFGVELPQVIRSSMTHSVAFMSVTPGDVQAGEPDVLLMPHSAQWSAGLWDFRRRALKAAMAVNDVDDYGFPTLVTLYTPEQVIECRRTTNWFVQDVRRHKLGRVPVEVLPFRPEIDRPFGRSVITRAVMSITDDAVRTALRTEASAEFYSAPYLVLLGASPDSFIGDDGKPIPAWEFIMGHINAVEKDEDGDVPTLQQLSQQNVQPHIQQMQQLASRFSGETNVPVSSLGVISDNPPSAEAMHQAERDLIIDCSAANRVYGAALSRLAQDAVVIRDGADALTDELRRISVRWRNPALPSVLDSGDAIIKIISAMPWIADTTVALEEMGFTDEQITRLLNDKRKSETRSALDSLISGGNKDDGQPTAGTAASQPNQGGGTGSPRSGETVGDTAAAQPRVAA